MRLNMMQNLARKILDVLCDSALQEYIQIIVHVKMPSAAL